MHLNLRIRKETNRLREGGGDEDLLFSCYYCEHVSSKGQLLRPQFNPKRSEGEGGALGMSLPRLLQTLSKTVSLHFSLGSIHSFNVLLPQFAAL